MAAEHFVELHALFGEPDNHRPARLHMTGTRGQQQLPYAQLHAHNTSASTTATPAAADRHAHLDLR